MKALVATHVHQTAVSLCAVFDAGKGRQKRSKGTEGELRATCKGGATQCSFRWFFSHLTSRQQPCTFRLAQLNVVEGLLESSQIHLRALLSRLVKRVSHSPAGHRLQSCHKSCLQVRLSRTSQAHTSARPSKG